MILPNNQIGGKPSVAILIALFVLASLAPVAMRNITPLLADHQAAITAMLETTLQS